MKLSIVAGATSQSVNVFVRDSSSTTGAGLAAVAPAGGSLLTGAKLYYSFSGANASAGVAVSLSVLAAVNSAWSSAGVVTLDGTNMIGWVRIDLPNAAITTGKGRSVSFLLYGGTNMAPTPFEIELTGWDNQDGVRGGMTALPNAAPAAPGGLLISAAGIAGATLDTELGRLDAAVSSRSTLTQTQVTGGAYDVTNASCLVHLASAQKVDVDTIKTQAVTCAAGVTILPNVGTATHALVVDASGFVTVVTNNDKAGYSLTQAFPANFSALGISAGGHVSNVDTLTTYTGNTVQTGDSFSLASGSSGFVAIKGNTAAVVAKLPANAIADETLVINATTAILAAVGAPAQSSQIPGNFTAALFASAGVFSVAALANAPGGGGGGGDPWSTAQPGSYGASTFGGLVSTALAKVNAAGLSVQAASVVPADGGTVKLVAGDDYYAANVRALTWSVSGTPSLAGATVQVLIYAHQAGGEVVLTLSCAVTATATGYDLSAEVSQVQSLALLTSTSGAPVKYVVRATLADAHVDTLVVGKLLVG